MKLRAWAIPLFIVGSTFILIFSTVVSAETQSASTPTPERVPAAETAETPPALSGLAALAASPRPMDQELAVVLQHQKTTLAELYTRFDAAPDQATAMAVQLEIRELQQGTEIQLLEIQAKYARQEGRDELAQRLDESIRMLKDPSLMQEKLRQPETRPDSESAHN